MNKAGIEIHLNNVTWGEQANIYFDVSTGADSIDYDLDDDGELDMPQTLKDGTVIPGTEGELNALDDLNSEEHDVTVLHVRDIDSGGAGVLGFHYAGDVVIGDRANGGEVQSTFSHEVGHWLGASHDGKSNLFLMHEEYGDAAKVKIGKRDWDEVQPLD